MIYADEDLWSAFTEADRARAYELYRAFADDARAAGVLAAGHELAPTSDATTVRVRDAQTLVTDGPYAEVKEALGGFFVLDCNSMEAALDWAARIPGAEHGAVEVRPIHIDPEEVQL
jgi:hypothetical protein